MKKNNKFVREKLKQQRTRSLLFNYVTLLIIFILLEAVLIISINVDMFSSSDEDIRTYINNIEYNLVQKDYTQNGEEITIVEQSDFGLNTSRVHVVAYSSIDGKLEPIFCSKGIVYYLTPNSLLARSYTLLSNKGEYETVLKKKIITPNLDQQAVMVLEEQSIDEKTKYYFRTATFKVDSASLDMVDYVKVFTMVNGEVQARKNLMKASMFMVAAMFVLSIGASIFLSYKTFKPVEASLDKQLAFVSDASHELRTPLAIVQSKLENILTQSSSTILEVSDDIAIALNEVSRLSKLTNELLLLAKEDQDLVILEKEVLDLNQLVLETTQDFKEIAEIENKGFTIEEMDKKILIYADKSLVKQVIIILLDNALRYTNSNDEIRITLRSEQGMALLKVMDTGMGISDEAKERIFERFYREDKARSREKGGNGLGLSIASQIIYRHNGKIYVSNNNPKGSVFTVEIPRCKKNINASKE